MTQKEKDARVNEPFPRAADGSIRVPLGEAEKRFGSIHDYFCHATLCDRQNASAFVEAYLPDVAKEFDVDRLEIVQNEIYSEELGKSALDILYELPQRGGDENLRVSLIVEHKAQSGERNERETLDQLFYYFASLCRRQLFDEKDSTKASKKKEPIRRAQPIVALLYTGADVNYESPSWEKNHPLPSSLSAYQVRFPIVCVNFTRLYRENKLIGSPFLRGMGALLASASLKDLPETFATIFKPYNEVGEWGERERFLASAGYNYVDKALKNLGRPLTKRDVDLIREQFRGKKTMDTMISYFDEIAMRAEERGKAEGKAEGIAEGKAEGIFASLLKILNVRFGFCPESLVESLGKIKSVESLERIQDFALVRASSLEEVIDLAEKELSEPRK